MPPTLAPPRAALRVATVAGLVGMAAPVLLAASPASAHVRLDVDTTAAGAIAHVRLEVPHGCAGSATTELAVRMPDGVSEATAETTDRWAAHAAPDAITFRTADPLPDGLGDQVGFTVRLPDDVGAVLVFPVVQRCEEGESAWTEVGEDAASRDELEQPAPVIVVTGPGEEGPVAGEPADGRLTAYGAAGLVTVGCLVSGAVLALRRRRA